MSEAIDNLTKMDVCDLLTSLVGATLFDNNTAPYISQISNRFQHLRDENARLKEALQGMLKLVDADVLVRNTANDHAVGWSTQTVLIVTAVQQANEALQPERGTK
jgi:hypothetical protein